MELLAGSEPLSWLGQKWGERFIPVDIVHIFKSPQEQNVERNKIIALESKALQIWNIIAFINKQNSEKQQLLPLQTLFERVKPFCFSRQLKRKQKMLKPSPWSIEIGKRIARFSFVNKHFALPRFLEAFFCWLAHGASEVFQEKRYYERLKMSLSLVHKVEWYDINISTSTR